MLHDFIEKHGPFNDMIGSFQDANIAASYLLRNANFPCPKKYFDARIFLYVTEPFDLDSTLYNILLYGQQAYCVLFGDRKFLHIDRSTIIA